jgi:DNA invertase Pin-like site-specific DNA recombinase
MESDDEVMSPRPKTILTTGEYIVFVKETSTFIGEDSPMSNLLLSVMRAFAQFERELIRERQCEGNASAKREGK